MITIAWEGDNTFLPIGTGYCHHVTKTNKMASCRHRDAELQTGLFNLYFTTKRLHEQYRVSSGQYRWIYCPLVPEGSIKFSVIPAGKKNEKKCFFSLNLTDFNKLFLKIDQKIEPESILRV